MPISCLTPYFCSPNLLAAITLIVFHSKVALPLEGSFMYQKIDFNRDLKLK